MAIVQTSLGGLRGESKAGYDVWRGVRYAHAPVGDLRFRPPVPVGPWSGVIDALRFGPSAPQVIDPAAGGQLSPDEETAEDCLFLNIYAPSDSGPGARRPVMVWIHGGGYVGGSGRAYHGGALARDQGVVVVTLNYRLGALGFLHLGHLDKALAGSVNTGVLDQICALEWVRDHIAAFGGDPGNVTIFGESAGGTAVAMLVGAPRASDLFHKAAIHSPNADLIPVGEGHVAFANRCIARLGGDPGPAGLETLRRSPVEALVGLMAPDPEAPGGPSLGVRRTDNVGFSPAIDGILVPRPVAETIRLRGPDNPPLLIGGCRHEGTLFGPMILGPRPFTEAEAIALFEAQGVDGVRAMAVYEAFAPGSSPREKLVYALTDTMFRNGAVEMLDAAAEAGSPVWSWMCGWENDQPETGLRATHAIELAFLWDWIETSPIPTLAGVNPPRDLGRAMRAFWASFARDGRPVAPGEPAWTPYRVPDRSVLWLGAERRMEAALDDAVRAFWFGA